mgnify:CR=1 FL=1
MGNLKTISRMLLLLYIGIHASTAYGLALSEAALKSQFNQQLDVRIGLITQNVSELDDLRIQISQPEAGFANPVQFKYEIVKGENGNYLKITTRDVVREPVIEFTLDIGWSNGHVVRDYSFLIDPPNN